MVVAMVSVLLASIFVRVFAHYYVGHLFLSKIIERCQFSYWN